MTTLEFLRAILPEEGFKFLALARDGGTGLGHKAYESLEDMAGAIDSYDRQKNLQVYHACAAYKDAYFEVEVDGQVKRKYRGESNWFKVKSFWIDIDVGEGKAAEGKGYATKREAAEAILSFCTRVSLPRPMLVSSGGGLHCYWPLSEPVGPNSWRRVAVAFKSILAAGGVVADPTRTADLSSVLRPVGAHNKKPGRDPREVRVIAPTEAIPPQVFFAAVQAAVTMFDVTVREPTVYAQEGLNDDLTAHLGPQVDSSAQEVANRCAQVAVMRDTQGDVNYEHWRGVIGIIKHCVEGIELAHEWSERRGATGHSNTDTDVKYHSWRYGPTSCEFFQSCNPTGCTGCPHNGSIRSPIVLGRIVPEPAEEVVEAVTDEGETVETTVPEFPRNYQWNNGLMSRLMPVKDSVDAFPFCQTLFYPIQRIKKSDGTYAMTIRMHLPDQRIRDFELDTAAVATTNDMLKGFSRYELIPTNNKDAAMHMNAYLRDSVHKLMNEQKEVDTLTSFGWRENMEGFLLGDRLYHTDGTVRKVFVGGGAQQYKSSFPEPRGNVADYAEAVNFIYARENSEPVQYAYCNTYGSLLTPFGEDSYHGVLMCLVSGKSGKGKTTVSTAARYGLGDAQKMIFAGKSGSTWNARWSIMGTFKNVPVVWDEMTDIDPSMFSELAYTISQGADKSRLTSAGGKVGFAERHTWAQSPDLTANEDLLAKLSQHNANTQAEAMRTFQINLAKYNVPMIEPASDVSRAIEKMRMNWGCAGEAFVKHIVTHKSQVQQMFHVIEKKLSKELPESEYRFYRNHATCTLTAAKILIDLGVVAFDFSNLVVWTVKHIRDLVQTVVTGNMTNPADALNRFVRDISSRIIVTIGYRDARVDARGPEEPLNRIVGAAAGRRVMGSQMTSSFETKYVGKLFIAKKELADWCAKNRLEPKELIEEARIQGWLVPWNEKFNMGRGTAVPTGACAVYAFDFDAMEGSVEKTGGPSLQMVDPQQEREVSSTR